MSFFFSTLGWIASDLRSCEKHYSVEWLFSANSSYLDKLAAKLVRPWNCQSKLKQFHNLKLIKVWPRTPHLILSTHHICMTPVLNVSLQGSRGTGGMPGNAGDDGRPVGVQWRQSLNNNEFSLEYHLCHVIGLPRSWWFCWRQRINWFTGKLA